jgi:hypothetical protein
MKLTNVDLRGILACTFPVSPGPQGANCLQNQGTGAWLAVLPALAPRGRFLPTSRWNCRQNHDENLPRRLPCPQEIVTRSGPRQTRGQS